MLILNRKVKESIFLDTSDGLIEIFVSKVKGKSFSVAVNAPESVCVRRHNIKDPKPVQDKHIPKNDHRPLKSDYTTLREYLAACRASDKQNRNQQATRKPTTVLSQESSQESPQCDKNQI